MTSAVAHPKLVPAAHERMPAAPRAPQDHASTFQLLVAVILSAQTTDKKVNEVTPALFAAAGDAAGMAALEARLQLQHALQ